jgi:Leucine-rich repeat (LRR) protein
LYLQHNNIKKLENLSSLVNLQKLYLDNNHIEVVEDLDTMYKLEELYISNQELPEGVHMTFDDSSMKAISGSLTILNATNCQIEDIMNLGWLENVTKLNLSKNQIENLDAVQFVLSSNISLTEFDLSNNPINKIPKYRDKVVAASRRNLESLDGVSIGNNERQFVQTLEMKRKTTSSKPSPQITPRQPEPVKPARQPIMVRTQSKKVAKNVGTMVVDMTMGDGVLTVTGISKKDVLDKVNTKN